ncbi:biotin transporter BioY [Galbitalea sp. SE-J8]|uniref:biotin transporter BioY n=1 Tax=Galbitalea sp. SE-J8 TaxID=3054952 RepID=UPI00259CF4BB|nr:biotin transporter BioY [Galbitalea sp. SE-J8]MDM4763132.1 biotin transporter BioY [Galbitalea sp. SE-J8]
MSLSLAIGRPTLADRIFSRSLATDLVLVAAGAGLTAIAAQVSVPMWPVPLTGQTFAVLLAGTVLGSARGALSMALYLGLGLVGLPVFTPQADGSHLTGLAAVAGPTGGYLVGFVLAAALVGWLAQREWDHRALGTLLAFVAGTVVIYAVGLPWLLVALSGLGLPHPLEATLAGGLYPFLLGDGLKAVVAAGLLPLTWSLVRRADRAAAERRDS